MKSQAKSTEKKSKTKPSHYVGIGASAGGLEALKVFFNHMQPKNGMAFIIVQHLSPDYKSVMVELLSKQTEMEVLRVKDGVTIRPDTLYLIPPKKNMEIQSGRLYLSEQPQKHGLNLPIDVFFRSLAIDQTERAIGIVLSGTGSDGTRGIRAIKEVGGTVLVQDPDTAQFDGMPRSVVATGLADFTLPPEVMPIELLKFINHPFIAGKKTSQNGYTEEEDNLKLLFNLLQKKTNVNFSEYKPATVVRRIERRMGIVQVLNLDDYLSYIYRNPSEINTLFKDLLIGVTKFFRDVEAFNCLREKIIPQIFSDVEKRESKSIRVWVAGCSTGEEAYSIAMLFQEYMERKNHYIELKVFATDIDKEAIQFASTGLYPDSIVADIDVALFSRFFEKHSSGYRVKRGIRELVVFAMQNLAKDPPFTKVDMVSCRNLLIYHQLELQKRIIATFDYAINKGGYLFLGSSEAIGDMVENFQTVDAKYRIYHHITEGDIPIRNQRIVLPARGNTPTFIPRPINESLLSGFPSAKKEVSQENYYHSIIKALAPTVLIVNEKHELEQTFGNVKPYLHIPEGNISLDVLQMLPKELSLAASSALHRTKKKQQPIVFGNIKTKLDNSIKICNLKINYITTKEQPTKFVLVIEEQKKTDIDREQEQEQEPITQSNNLLEQRIDDLEQEVQFTRENLQATIEELQTSNEELQASNEELLAANEELQSTNEELQSVNEELNTVNTEYQAKNLELTEVNNDLKNLMKCTAIGTIFLDKEMRIRKFTQAVTQTINILAQDIGRPLSDLSIPMFSGIKKDATQVAISLAPVERRIHIHGNPFLIRILPFINEKNVYDGIVITLVDIQQQVIAEKEVQRRNEFLESMAKDAPGATLMVAESGKIIYANKQVSELLEIRRSNLMQMSLYSNKLRMLNYDEQPIDRNNSILTLLAQSKKMIEKYIVYYRTKSGKDLVMAIRGNPVLNKKKFKGAILQIDLVAVQ